jgi:hypothetical protein
MSIPGDRITYPLDYAQGKAARRQHLKFSIFLLTNEGHIRRILQVNRQGGRRRRVVREKKNSMSAECKSGFNRLFPFDYHVGDIVNVN